MLPQVSTMLSHQSLARTAKCTKPRVELSRPSRTSRFTGSPESIHVASIRASIPRSTGIASASHAQFAHQLLSATRTSNAVGEAENGIAIRIAPLSGEMTRI